MEIKTLVYLDIEATGLKSSGRPRISEISLIAANSQDIRCLHSRITNSLVNNNIINPVENILPRVVNKLTLCVYPMATVPPLVTDITGLDNYNLDGQARFDENTGFLINSFLARLPSPVCLVSHNGAQYDFPLLKAELEHSGTELRYDLLCVDSYVGIKDLFKTDRKFPTPTSFSLINLHKHLLGCPPEQSHGAEADCLALMRITALMGEDFLVWINDNYYKFRHCKAMWKMEEVK